MHVSSLHLYPLKSARGLTVETSIVTAKGLPGDRDAMVVDPSGHFITQREEPGLAMISARWEGRDLVLVRDGETLVARPDVTRLEVEVWGDEASAVLAQAPAHDVLSSWLGRPVRLVMADAGMKRIADRDWVDIDTPVGFTDGFQILVATTASLAKLNRSLADQGLPEVGMERFRPNIVIDDETAFGDDHWAEITIGPVRLALVKPCTRCIMTTQDQLTGRRDIADPMPALRALRMSGDARVKGVLFGWNAVPLSTGTISVGDDVIVTRHRPEGWAMRAARVGE